MKNTQKTKQMQQTKKASGRGILVRTYGEFETIKEFLSKKLETNKSFLGFAMIVHDKDTVHKGENEGQTVEPHIHITMRFENTIAEKTFTWFNDPCLYIDGQKQNTSLQFVTKIENIDYLTHKNQPEKYQYSEAEVYKAGVIEVEEYNNYKLKKDTERQKEKYDAYFEFQKTDSIDEMSKIMVEAKMTPYEINAYNRMFKDKMYFQEMTRITMEKMSEKIADLEYRIEKMAKQNNELRQQNTYLKIGFPEEQR